ncbi:type II toxin-antitoxin system VapC family toxin [Candidatus Woesearchaeota archaeon]|nr:type II toxin-antitoxin system VapC family toxin [Candidatus Woesearchaeota archaeon]
MEQKICLDTDICIEIVKNSQVGRNIINSAPGGEALISSITVFELYLRETNLDKVNSLLDKFNVLPFDGNTAKIASGISKSLKKSGFLIEIRDIFIAATCIGNKCSLATLNKKHFERIKGLEILDV